MGQMSERLRRGMSLPEVLLAIALLAITFLSLMSVLASGLRADKKDYVKDSASAAAELILNRELRQIRTSPAAKQAFWNSDYPDRNSPYSSGLEVAGSTEFHYDICTRTVDDTSGSPFNGTEQRLKQVEIFVRWGGDDTRVGFGSTVYHELRYVSEASDDDT